jgi:hypothetical protein
MKRMHRDFAKTLEQGPREIALSDTDTFVKVMEAARGMDPTWCSK